MNNHEADETTNPTQNAERALRSLLNNGDPSSDARPEDCGRFAQEIEALADADPEDREGVLEALCRSNPAFAELATGGDPEDKTSDTEPPAQASSSPTWKPFPVDALPGPAAGYVRASAEAVGCRPAMVALPTLTGLSAAVGSTTRLRLKSTWKEPATLWAMLVAPSGSAKSPAMKQALRPIYRREREARKQFEMRLKAWEQNEDASEADKPQRPRFRTGDATPEGIMKLLGENPRGILLARNELGAWLGSFDRYAQGASDLQFWIEVWDGLQASRDRAGDGNVTVDSPSVPIFGTIQPGALSEKLTPVHFESGFAARFLLACPPTDVLQWTEADVTRETKEGFEELLNRLYDLPPGTELSLSEAAKERWVAYYNTSNKEAHDHPSPPAKAAAMKAIRYGARLALLVHLSRRAAGETGMPTTGPESVDLESMKRGLRLARWLRRETLRVYQRLNVVKHARPPVLRFLDALPDTGFTTQEAKALANRFEVTERTIDNWLRKLSERGELHRIRRGLYEKSA